MSKYFDNVKEGEKVYGLVFGPGVVISVWGKNSYYAFEVSYDNGYVVPYTIEGIPAWNTDLDEQTVFYKEDIDLCDIDFGTLDEILSVKKIIKLRSKKKLEVRCPSGIWRSIDKCPNYIIDQYLENGKLHLFRKGN